MLNEEKVKHMTKAAAYENGPGKNDIGISSYFRGDYLGLQMVKSGIAYTVAFFILLAIWSMGKMEELMLMLSRPDYLERLIKTLVLLYASGLVLYEIAIYTYYAVKFSRAKQSVKDFHYHLKNIHKFYETQETVDTILDLDQETDEESTL